ncbi:porin-like protein [Rhizobium subbaraonis]|uniref:Porin n=9 Tax=Rhizobiaceae TaxID=82115 RepID=A0A285UDU7_9HYPH|nr:porin-like protein [Rhizobium subbaraonis]
MIVLFLKLGMGQGTLSFSKKTQTRMKLLTGGQKMNIKSLLLGSAAALAAVSGAQAADAIVAAEPEPMEYVRVCDAFGTGYFYIPGTETCLKIGGYLRVEWKGGDVQGTGQNTFPGGGGDSWNTRTRATLKFSTATDTEYGALKTYAEVEFQKDNNNGGSTNLAHGYIEFAGFLLGYTDSLFAGGYIGGGYSNNDYILVNYGDTARNQIRYTYGDTSNGFSFTAGVEDSSDNSGDFLGDSDKVDTYVPNVVGGMSYSTGGFQAFLVGGYDAVVEEGAIKGRINATFGAFSAYVMAGWNTDGDYQNDYAQWYGDWAVWLGAKYQFTEKLAIYGDFNFMDQGATDSDGNFTDAGKFETSIGLDYAIVPGFKVRPEVSYVADYDQIAGDKAEDWGGMIRFQRDF